jgi:hypothetical protein
MSLPAVWNIRRSVASAASIAVGVSLYRVWCADGSSRELERVFVDATIAFPFAVGGLIWIPRLPVQLLARGAWWSLLLLNAVMALVGDAEDRHAGANAATFTALALLAVGSGGLDNRGWFAPVAFRGTLLIALVLAIADAGAFLWFGTGSAVYNHSWSVLAMVPAMVVGVIGLLQLRVWGLIASLATNVTIAILALTDVLSLPSPLRELFVGSAVVQLVVPLPMVVAMVRHRAPSADAWRRTKAAVPPLLIASIALLSVYAAYIHHGNLLHG